MAYSENKNTYKQCSQKENEDADIHVNTNLFLHTCKPMKIQTLKTQTSQYMMNTKYSRYTLIHRTAPSTG